MGHTLIIIVFDTWRRADCDENCIGGCATKGAGKCDVVCRLGYTLVSSVCQRKLRPNIEYIVILTAADRYFFHKRFISVYIDNQDAMDFIFLNAILL